MLLLALLMGSVFGVSAATVEEETDKLLFDTTNWNCYYTYTGEVVKPEIVMRWKSDHRIASPDEYTVVYGSNGTDGTSVGISNFTVYYIVEGEEKKVSVSYEIVPGKTDKVDAQVLDDGRVTVSWNPVPGAKAYRVYKYSEETKRYAELYWPDGEIASPDTSRTFTSEELKPGEVYKMGIMALGGIEYFPSPKDRFMAYFTVDLTEDRTSTTEKPTTTQKPTSTQKPTEASEATTTSLATEQTTTSDAQPTEDDSISATEGTDAATGANPPSGTTEKGEGDFSADAGEKEPSGATTGVIILVASLLVISGVALSVFFIRKQKMTK